MKKLLIIDEEQKFGVSVKEKLRKLKTNIDTLTMSATPIPRTLQFSLMGARDMSIIRTPPPNRHPIHTELGVYGSELITDAINFEMSHIMIVVKVGNLNKLFRLNTYNRNVVDMDKTVEIEKEEAKDEEEKKPTKTRKRETTSEEQPVVEPKPAPEREGVLQDVMEELPAPSHESNGE